MLNEKSKLDIPIFYPLTEKPPIELMPKKLFLEQRLEELTSAMIRYLQVDKDVPNDWIEEYKELKSYLKTATI